MTRSNPFSLLGQVAVVTGAGRGIGRGIAICLAQAGAKVVLIGRTSSYLEETAADIAKTGGSASGITADASVVAQLNMAADHAEKVFGPISIWINNAGGQPENAKHLPFVDLDEKAIDDTISSNIKTVWAGMHVAAERIRTGSIVNISSRAARSSARPGFGFYAATKAAINNLTATLATELAPSIRVNAIAPGPVLTPSFHKTMGMDKNEAENRIGSNIPLQRLGTPEDIGNAAVFLCSPAASWISGQCLYVTGGS